MSEGQSVPTSGKHERERSAAREQGYLKMNRREAMDALVRKERLIGRLMAERNALRDALRAAEPVLQYVSAGRGYVQVNYPYPDATARRALALLQDALTPAEEARRG